MADIGWRRRRGSSPAARTGARQRAGLTPPPPTHFHASGRRFTHNSSGQSKNPLTAITVSTAIGSSRRLRLVPGVSDVLVLGGKTKEFQAEIDLNRMRAFGV